MASTVSTQQRRMTRKRVVIIGILTGVVVLFVLFSPYGVVTRWSLERDLQRMHEQQATIAATGDSLRRVIHTLTTDTLEIERIAREQYGYVRDGEEVYLIDRNSTEDE